MKHIINSKLLDKKVNIHLVGVGGGGSQALSGLARLHLSMLALGHPYGIDVTVYDFDTVSNSNIGRQLFSPADVGLNKAIVLVNRVNMFYGFNWKACPTRYPNTSSTQADIVVSCVDTRKSRREIAKHLSERHGTTSYWLDLGNRASDGQVVLGQPKNSNNDKVALRLPTITELYPEILDPKFDEQENDTPSCSLEEALFHQELFICQEVATAALQILYSLFRYGGVDYHGKFINQKSGMTSPLRVDPETWERFGFNSEKKETLKNVKK